MSTKNKNLSLHNADLIPHGGSYKVGIVVSEWNDDITFPMLEACKKTLIKYGVGEDEIVVTFVPGAFELPLGARHLLTSQKLDGVVCIGCVIKGETMHDEYINSAVANGIMQLGLTSGKPVIFGVLTPNNKQQAIDRAGGTHGNKGVEAAITVLKMINMSKLSKGTSKGIGFS
jgi:6,7-dimethyl-8-ribityllumazine synthase